MKFPVWSVAVLALTTFSGLRAAETAPVTEPKEISFTGDAAPSFASGVAVPAGRASFWTSGITATVIKKDATTIYERYGDTYVQGVSCLKNIQANLAKQGLTLKDVVFLRVYVAPDATKSGKPDFPSWFRAYGEFFNNKENPAKTARTTIGVAALVNPDLLIEIEALVVYPRKK